MSTKRQANEESYEALQALFLRIAEGDPALVHCDEIWRQVLADLWFRAEVRRIAVQVIGGNVDDPLCDDIAQQVVVQLRAKLSSHCDLGADAEQLRDHFPGWMGNIIRNCCIDTLRSEARHVHELLTDTHQTRDLGPQEDLRLDMADAIDRLELREREVAYLKLRKFSDRDAAAALNLTRRQVQLSFKKVKAWLRTALRVYRKIT